MTRRFVKLEEEPSGNLVGGPIVLDDGRVAGIQVKMDDGYYWFLTMDEVVDILQENSDGEIGGTPMDDSKIFPVHDTSICSRISFISDIIFFF